MENEQVIISLNKFKNIYILCASKKKLEKYESENMVLGWVYFINFLRY